MCNVDPLDTSATSRPHRPLSVRLGWLRSGAAAVLLSVLPLGLPAFPSCMPPQQAPKAPEKITITYKLPKLAPVKEGTETQEKGGVIVQMAPSPFTVDRSTEKSCTQQRTTFVTNNQYPYEVRETPKYDVPQTHLVFKVKVTNKMDQVLKLEGTIFKLNVDGKEIALDQAGYKEFTSGILTPGEQKEFTITGPEWRALPEQATVQFSIYSLTIGIDQAGTVTERGNFDWTFKFKAEEVSEETEVPVQVVYMTQEEAATACGSAEATPAVPAQ